MKKSAGARALVMITCSPQWRGVLKRVMDDQIARRVDKVVDRSKGKIVGAKTIFKRKVGQGGRV